MKKICATLLIGGLLFGQVSFAQTSEEQQLQVLMRQVKVLLNEVARLQSQLVEHTSGVTVEMEEAEVDDVISGGVSWLVNAQEQNGHFRYEYAPYENTYLQKDNIVRQAGAFYALGEVLRRDENNVYDLKDKVALSAEFFADLSLEDSYDGRNFQCVVSTKSANTCILGTTGLVILGLIDLVETHPSYAEKYAPLIDQYAQYLLVSKKAGAGFRNYHLIGSSEQREDESSFSTGEAMLALARYYRFHPTDEVKEVIEETFVYMQDDMPFDFGLYLWATAALKELQHTIPNEAYAVYVKEYTDWRVFNFKRHRGSSHNMCAYVEGVVSAYSVLEDTATEAQKEVLLEDIHYWLDKSAQLQITGDDVERLVYSDGKASFAQIEDIDKAIGGFLTGEHELTQRIDYTQHCLSSFIQKKVDIDELSL